MAVVSLDFRKAPPATGGQPRVYIKPGIYGFKITKYDDKDSKAGNPMHTFTFAVMRGEEKGKTITDYMAITAKDAFGLRKLHALLLACGVKVPTDKPVRIDLARLVGKELAAEIVDRREEAQTVNGQTYPARTVSQINEYLTPAAARKRLDDADDDDDDEDFDEDDDDLDEENEDEADDDADDDDDDEEDEEPSAKPSRARAAAKAPAKAAAKPARRAKKEEPEEEEEEDDDDFPFDDDDEDEEPEEKPAPRRRRR